MSPAETRRAAKVMVDSLKKGAVVEIKLRDSRDTWSVSKKPAWVWSVFDYRIAKKKRRKAK